MAIFRKIHTSIWSDSYFSELDKDKKLFYLYLLTNERTKQCGVYEITKKQIAFDVGYTIDRVSILLEYFVNSGKIRFNSETKEIAIGNWLKYNSSTSPKVQSCINKEFANVKDTVLIEYVKSMDTRSQEEEEQEEEQEEEEEEEEEEEQERKIEVILSFNSEIFKEQWQFWKDYKKGEFNFKYKTIQSEQAALKKLSELAKNNESDAIKIIHQSFENGWKGFFKIKSENGKEKGFTNQLGEYFSANDPNWKNI